MSTVIIPFYTERPAELVPFTRNPNVVSPLISVVPSEWDVVEVDMVTREIFIWSPAYSEAVWTTLYRRVANMLRHEYTKRMGSSGDVPSFDQVWKPIAGDRKKEGVSRRPLFCVGSVS